MTRAAPSVIGSRAEMAVASALHRAGHVVFVPIFAGHGRVDLVTCGPVGPPTRIQAKTSKLVNGAIVFRTCSNTANVPADYRGDVDAFGVYSPELNLVYVVPVDDVRLRRGYLRVEAAANGQRTGVRWASEYELGPP